MAEKSKLKALILEFIRYVFVGGVAFLADTGILFVSKEYMFSGGGMSDDAELALSVAAGFFVGLIVNYILSQIFVFNTRAQQEKGLRLSSFLIFAIVGIIGLGLTEAGMLIGVRIVGNEGLWYLLVKCFVTGFVLIWNYAGRKIFVYRGK